MKNFLLVFLLTANVNSILASEKCLGFVFDYEFAGDTFSGMCKDESPDWGEYYFNGGDYYIGFFKQGKLWRGTYFWKNGDYRTGERFNKDRFKNDSSYNYFGRTYIAETGNISLGYYDENKLSGFGMIIYENDLSGKKRETETGMFNYSTTLNGAALHGYGMRQVESEAYIGFWQNGGIVGDYYKEDDYGNLTKYEVRGSSQYGPYELNNSDLTRYNKINNFVDIGIDDLINRMDKIETFTDEYEAKKSSYKETIESNIETDESNNIIYDKDLVISIQELLVELGYSLGEIDGVLGDRTIAAIKAFEIELELDELTGLPTETILIGLQLAIRAKNSSNSTKVESDIAVIATGTGFYINNNSIVTNNHVVDGCEYVTDHSSNKLNLVVADVVNDLALLKGPKKSSFLDISRNPPELGEKVYVSGYPFASNLKSFMITSGNVSSLTGLGKNFTNFSHTAPSQPGNSGGPIVNEHGSVVGVLVGGIAASKALSVDLKTGEVDGNIPQNINFGIKNTVLKSLLSDNNIAITIRDGYFSKSQKDIAKISKDASVLINCFGYYDQN